MPSFCIIEEIRLTRKMVAYKGRDRDLYVVFIFEPGEESFLKSHSK